MWMAVDALQAAFLLRLQFILKVLKLALKLLVVDFLLEANLGVCILDTARI